MSSLRICVYNYKGGAAKTTIVVNTGAALAIHAKKKVLLMDLDPQCNTSQFYHDDSVGTTLGRDDADLPPAANAAHILMAVAEEDVRILTDDLHPNAQAASMDALVDQNNPMNSSLYRIMNALFIDVQADVDAVLQSPNLLHKCNPDKCGDNLWLLEGTPLLSQFESELHAGFANVRVATSIKRFGVFSFLMKRLTDIYDFDVILVDCSPSNSAINKAAALSCDYILPPCQAGLYSAGSVYGLLSTVLPGDNGWLGEHDEIRTRWRSNDGTPKANVEPSMVDFLLPYTAPLLLPIMVSNYGMEGKPSDDTSPSTSQRKSVRKMGGDAATLDRRITFSSTQFVYTIMNYVHRVCPYIIDSPTDPPPSFAGPLIEFVSNHSRRVLPFAANAPISMPVTEQLGRSYVELTLSDFTEYYGLPVSTKKRKASSSSTPLDNYGTMGKEFMKEIETMQARYKSVAAWIVQLHEKQPQRQ